MVPRGVITRTTEPQRVVRSMSRATPFTCTVGTQQQHGCLKLPAVRNEFSNQHGSGRRGWRPSRHNQFCVNVALQSPATIKQRPAHLDQQLGRAVPAARTDGQVVHLHQRLSAQQRAVAQAHACTAGRRAGPRGEEQF